MFLLAKDAFAIKVRAAFLARVPLPPTEELRASLSLTVHINKDAPPEKLFRIGRDTPARNPFDVASNGAHAAFSAAIVWFADHSSVAAIGTV